MRKNAVSSLVIALLTSSMQYQTEDNYYTDDRIAGQFNCGKSGDSNDASPSLWINPGTLVPDKWHIVLNLSYSRYA